MVSAFSRKPSPQFLLSEFLYSDCYSCVWDPSAFVGIGHIRREQKGKDKWFLKICNHWLDNGRSARLSASVSIFFLRHKPIYSGRTCGMWKASLHFGLSDKRNVNLLAKCLTRHTRFFTVSVLGLSLTRPL